MTVEPYYITTSCYLCRRLLWFCCECRTVYDSPLLELYKVSYAWYGLIGLSSCVVIGVVVSALTGGCRTCECANCRLASIDAADELNSSPVDVDRKHLLTFRKKVVSHLWNVQIQTSKRECRDHFRKTFNKGLLSMK